MIVRVVPDVSGVDKVFDYRVPEAMVERIRLGDVVRVPLNGRSVAGWVIDVLGDTESEHRDKLLDVGKWSSRGPGADVLDLAQWAAGRYFGRLRSLLTSASPERNVSVVPAARHGRLAEAHVAERDAQTLEAIGAGGSTMLVRGPCYDLTRVVGAAASMGPVVVVMPTQSRARGLAAASRKMGLTTALYPQEWQAAAAGVDVVVGARAAVWASVPRASSILVVDEHDEALQEERMPTWNARDVAIERGRRRGVPVLLVSSVPSAAGVKACERILSLDDEKWAAQWPRVVVVDRSTDERFGANLLSSEAIEALRNPRRRVALVLNTKGRARLIACGNCRRVVRCPACDGPYAMDDASQLVCSRCSTSRPAVCAECGSMKMALIRQGVARLQEDVARAAGVEMTEVMMVSATTTSDEMVHGSRLLVGTEAVLHRARDLDDVVILDVDAELLAPRYRAAEAAMTLIARAAWAVSRSSNSPRVIIHTRDATHPALRAFGDLGVKGFVDYTLEQRRTLGLPPFSAMVELSGEGVDRVEANLRSDLLVDVARVDGEKLLVRAASNDQLDESLRAAGVSASGDLRVARDPLRA